MTTCECQHVNYEDWGIGGERGGFRVLSGLDLPKKAVSRDIESYGRKQKREFYHALSVIDT